MKILIGIALFVSFLSFSAVAQSQSVALPGTAFGPIVGNCDARTTPTGGGQVCHVSETDYCFEAPEGNYIMEETVHVDAGRRFSGESYGCSFKVTSSVRVLTYVQVPKKVCITGHAHSPSGMPHINERGGVQCTMNGRYDSLDNLRANLKRELQK